MMREEAPPEKWVEAPLTEPWVAPACAILVARRVASRAQELLEQGAYWEDAWGRALAETLGVLDLPAGPEIAFTDVLKETLYRPRRD